jgi:hypothetical protein
MKTTTKILEKNEITFDKENLGKKQVELMKLIKDKFEESSNSALDNAAGPPAQTQVSLSKKHFDEISSNIDVILKLSSNQEATHSFSQQLFELQTLFLIQILKTNFVAPILWLTTKQVDEIVEHESQARSNHLNKSSDSSLAIVQGKSLS